MRSPFPGMDPYLESPVYWQDFHSRFINSISESIADALPRSYFARIEEEVVLLEPETVSKAVRPDVLIGRDPFASGTSSSGGAAVAQLDPSTLHNLEHLDPHTHAYIEILREPDREVVTVIELLSPTNKDGNGRGIYLDKRNRLLRQSISVVELDLLRAGRRVDLVEPLPAGDYYALVSRADRRPECQVYNWTVRHPLPTIPIPLRAPDDDIRVNLGDAFAVAYQRGRYERMLSYEGVPPAPTLSPADAEWANQLAAKARGVR